MTTIAAAIKNGKVAIAADSLVSNGSTKALKDYLKESDKILKINDAYIGFTGYCASIRIAEHLILTEPNMFQLNSRIEIFSTLIRLQRVLKNDYYINASSDDNGNPTEINHLNFIVINQNGIFSADENRDVQRYTKFWALGSGSEYALGAMEALYSDEHLSAEALVRKAVEVSERFDPGSALPAFSYTIDHQPQPETLPYPTRTDFKLEDKREEKLIELKLEELEKDHKSAYDHNQTKERIDQEND